MSKTGALVAFVFRFSVIVIAGSQHFSMATNFMQKIYSVEGKPSEDHDQGTNKQYSNLGSSQVNDADSREHEDLVKIDDPIDENAVIEQDFVRKEIESR